MTMTLSGTTGGIGVIGSGTAVASTSGTSIDFTSLPAGLKRITVMFNGVSTSGTSGKQIQIGSGSVTTSGYFSCAGSFFAGTATVANSTTGFLCVDSSVAARAESGIITLCNQTGNTWVMQSSLSQNSFAILYFGGGIVSLGGTLDRVRITTVNGTDTFDAGSINILYE